VVVSGLAGVDTGVRQAALAVRTLDGRPGVAAFDDRLPEALLLTSPEVAGRLVAVWLGPLLALPALELDPLLETLEAWVATGGSTTHTAARVHCHRNTVINRLRRIATLTGQDRFEGVPPLELGLALRALGSGLHR
jgi:DNA-binding PucR family transcriptional regulator